MNKSNTILSEIKLLIIKERINAKTLARLWNCTTQNVYCLLNGKTKIDPKKVDILLDAYNYTIKIYKSENIPDMNRIKEQLGI